MTGMAARGRFSQHFANFQPDLPTCSQHSASFEPGSCQTLHASSIILILHLATNARGEAVQGWLWQILLYKSKVDAWLPHIRDSYWETNFMDSTVLLTVGSFLLTMELFYFSTVYILGALQRQVVLQGVFVKIGDFIKFKGFLVELLENRRS